MSFPTKGIVTDATPRVAVRWDDGTLGQDSDVDEAIRFQVPVSINPNYNTLRDGGDIDESDLPVSTRMTIRQIDGIQTRCAQAGVPFCLMNHSRNNWSQHGSNIELYTWDEILAELDQTDIRARHGFDVVTYLQPGDASLNPWGLRHRELIKSALRATGHKWAFGLVGPPNATHVGTGMELNNPEFGMYGSSAPVGNVHQVSGQVMRPGMFLDPMDFPDLGTIDIGTKVVTRGSWNGSSIDPDSGSGARGWLLGRDNGEGVAGDINADARDTWLWSYTRALALGYSFTVGLHGEARSNAISISTLSTGKGSSGDPSVLAGHFSVRHLMWTLRALEDAGFIVLTTMDGLAEYLWGDYAPGIELIGNPECRIPHKVIGDDAGGELCYPAGLTHEIVGQNARPSSNNCFMTCPVPDTLGEYENPGGSRLADVIGAAAPGVRGRSGGFTMKPTADPTLWQAANLGWVGLRAGFYRFSIDFENPVTGNLALSSLYIVGVRYLLDPMTKAGNVDNDDGHASSQWTSIGMDRQRVTANPSVGEWSSLEVPVYLPIEPTPKLGAKSASVAPGTVQAVPVADKLKRRTATVTSADLASIADAATLDVDLTVTGAVAGQLVEGFTTTDLQGLTFSLSVPAADTVRVTLHNDTGGPVDLGTTTWTVTVHGFPRFTFSATIPGAQPGSPVQVLMAVADLGLTCVGTVTAEDTVDVELVNGTGSAQAVTTGDIYVLVDDLGTAGTAMLDRATAWGPWVYCLSMVLTKDGTSPCHMTNPQLVYNPPM